MKIKRYVSLALVLAAVLTLSAACSKKPEPTPSMTLEQFYASVVEKNEVPMMAKLEGTMLTDTYDGIGEIKTKNVVAYMPMITAAVFEITMLELEDAKDAAAAQTVLQKRIDYQKTQGAWYPASMDAWAQNSRIEVCGRYILMIASDEAATSDAIVKDFKAVFGV